MLFVLIFTSLSSLVITPINEETAVEEPTIEMPKNAEYWLAGARSSATAWLKETVDNDGETGLWTSSAIADDGTIWVSFYSVAGRDLKVAHWNGWSWDVDDVYTFGDIGKYSEMAIDSDGNPRIASYDITNAVLRISRHDGTSWNTHTVAPSENTGDGNPYAGEGRIGFAIDDSDSEWFSFYTTSSSGEYNLSFANCDVSCQNSQLAGELPELQGWGYGTIDDGLGEDGDWDDYSDIGQFSSLQIGADGRPHTAYTCAIVNTLSDPVSGTTINAWYTYSLRYASFDGGGWAISDIDINETGRPYNPAYWLQLEIDSNGNEYIAYQNTSGWDSVRLAVKSGSSWSHSMIANGSSNIGDYIRIESDSIGDLHIAYYDYSNEDLVLLRGSSATWETVNIASLGSVGSFADISIDANDEEVFSYYDGDESDLIIASPASDADGDGLADGQDRCMNTPAGKIIDNTGCHYEKQILTSSGSDSAYVDVAKGDDGLLRLVHFRGMTEDGTSCDKNVANMTDDCNLVYRKQNLDGTWGASEILDQGGETGRYASLAIASDGTESVAFHAKTAINGSGVITETAAKIATNSGSGWDVEIVARNNSTGWYTDVAVDSQGNRTVSYTDNSGAYSELKVARKNGTHWFEETVQVNGTFASVDYVNDIAHVSYYSSNPHMIRLAIENGSNWDIHNVTTSGVVGTYRLDTDVTDDGRLLINYFRGRDSASDIICDAPQECTIQVAEWNGTAFTYHILDQRSDTLVSYMSVVEDSAGLIHSAWYDSGKGALQIASPTRTGWESITVIDDATAGRYPKLLVNEFGWEEVWYHTFADEDELREVKRFAWEMDHDFVENDDDQCPDTPYGAEDVDMWGCASGQRDDDIDGVLNSLDLCPNTPGYEGHLVDLDGCSPSQKDTDEDGVNDAQDQCPGTTDLATVDSVGCSDEERDSDGDGVSDSQDQCPDTPMNDNVDLNGCGESQRDNDGDGTNDKIDFMPQDASQQYDTDGDGYGDNPNGTNGDDCPNNSGTSSGELVGCPDHDDDGVADDNDDDDDNDGFSDVDEIANGTDPHYALDFPGAGEGGGDSTDNDGGNTDNTSSDGDGGTDAASSGGVSTPILAAIFAVVILLLIGVAVLLMTGGKKDASAMPAIPSLAAAEAQLAGATAAPTPEVAAPATSSAGQTGEMVPTGNPCKHCGAQEVFHIPSYGADYCKACSQYN